MALEECPAEDTDDSEIVLVLRSAEFPALCLPAGCLRSALGGVLDNCCHDDFPVGLIDAVAGSVHQ